MTPSVPRSTFSASELAKAIGVSKRAVTLELEAVAPSSSERVRGQEARTWRVADLPESLRGRLVQASSRLGFDDPEMLLQRPATTWEPSLPLKDILPAQIEQAHKLRAALALPLARMNEPGMGAEQLADIGLREYARTFGHRVTPRHWQFLFARTRERDRGLNDFERLEIYLSDHLTRKPAPVAPGNDVARTMQDAIPANPTNVSDTDVEYVWYRAFDEFDQALERGKAWATAKAEVLKVLQNSPLALASSTEALRKKFERKYARWIESGRASMALKDQRQFTSGRFRRPELTKDDWETLLARCLEHGGRISEGWRCSEAQ